MKLNKDTKIALFVGGVSPEREVSKVSGKAVYNALIEAEYTVKIFDPAYGFNQPENIEDFFSPDKQVFSCDRNAIDLVNSNLLDEADIVFLGLHGAAGEDGKIQALLEMRGIKYTGSPILASALAMDKNLTKMIIKNAGIATAEWVCLNDKNADFNQNEKEILEQLQLPLVVKPNSGGSTIGLSICKNEGEMPAAIKLAFEYSNQVLVEKFIKGREITVGILGELTLPVLEIKPSKEIYDYECKYTSGMSQYEVPAKIDEDVFVKVQDSAKKIYDLLGCQNYGRVDFLLTPDNKFYCLEVNTLPGMTGHSLVPKMATSIGIKFINLLENILDTALK